MGLPVRSSVLTPHATPLIFRNGGFGEGDLRDGSTTMEPAAASNPFPSQSHVDVPQEPLHVILFYKYHPLSSDAATTERFRAALHTLCAQLQLTGRILVAASEREGINGTLAGSFHAVAAFTCAMMPTTDGAEQWHAAVGSNLTLTDDYQTAMEEFQRRRSDFFRTLQLEELTMTAEEFKWSVSSSTVPLFPDLHVKLVKELIGTGGLLEQIPISETAKGYLTPKEWHEIMLSRRNQQGTDDTILIDCRNTKEYEIGHFPEALDPKTTTFSQFSKWVNDNEHLLAEKKVLMYCTGGIRCEKASAYIRRQIPTVKDVCHLKGGIHKYLEEFGSDGTWLGKNFVFDNRMATGAEETRLGRKGDGFVDHHSLPEQAIGQCAYCTQNYDEFHPACVCTVCREPLLVCPSCRAGLVEFHCRQHFQWKDAYFSRLDRFSTQELESQLQALTAILHEIGIGRKFKQKRKTIQKQMDRVHRQLESLPHCSGSDASICRHCGDKECNSQCWGFHGLKRKQTLDASKSRSKFDDHDEKRQRATVRAPRISQPTKKDLLIEEITRLSLSKPPQAYRQEDTGIRVPPCSIRELRCYSKPKWCGKPILKVLKDEFIDLSKPENMKRILEHKLLRLNGQPVESVEASGTLLKQGDLISRLVHWHEAPVIVPAQLDVEKITLPLKMVNQFQLSHDSKVYVCNKPSSVPVHPAGPYLSNTLTVMVEAQEGLPPTALIPLHRTDRVTSGLVLLCTNPQISRIFQRCFTEKGRVRKLYIAKVTGKFFASDKDLEEHRPTNGIGTAVFLPEKGMLEVDAPIETVDPAKGLRAITRQGKPAETLFRLVDFDAKANTSLVACYPITGRNHQIRVHLSWLGFPIVGDEQYGGKSIETDLKDHVLSCMESACYRSSANIPGIAADDFQSSKASCICCNGGKEGYLQSFTNAQLLLGGHAILLHACRYLMFVPNSSQAEEENLEIEFAVPLPDWAAKLDKVDWLEHT